MLYNEMLPHLIHGNKQADYRGEVSFVNDFDMLQVRRFYRIQHYDTTIKRGWRAHRIEQRWFYLINGIFEIKVVEIDNWDKPNANVTPVTFTLTTDNKVLHIPNGYGTCIQALQANSDMIIFADSLITEASKDNYLYPVDYFNL
jgi:hypothetical protein